MDREKVIEAFDEAKELVWTDDDEYTVGYNNGLEAGKNIALALLKEQEAVKPKSKSRHGEYPQIVHRCGSCNEILYRYYKFCPSCGRAVKWE